MKIAIPLRTKRQGQGPRVDPIYGAGKLDRRVDHVEDLMRQWRVREADATSRWWSATA